MNTPLKTILALSGALLLTSSFSHAASVSTQPVGYTTWNIAAGTGASSVYTTLGLPLYAPTSSIDGVASGVIEAVGADAITVSSAGWTAGQLSEASMPYCIRITSGLAEGRNLLVSTSNPNSDTVVNIDLVSSSAPDLTTLGIVVGTDTFEIIECDTLASLFGEPSVGGIVGASDISNADQVWVFVGGTLEKYYYDTDDSFWAKTSGRGGVVDVSNQPILPDAGILFARKANSSSKFIITGTVPDNKRQVTIRKSGLTFLGSAWPADMTLANSGIAVIEGWQTSMSGVGADQVLIFNGGTQSKYFHDGTNWLVSSGRGVAIANDVVIESGSAVIISKAAPYTQDVVLTQLVPYTL